MRPTALGSGLRYGLWLWVGNRVWFGVALVLGLGLDLWVWLG